MNYCLKKNVIVTFEKDRILFVKGVWKIIPFEIEKKNYKHCWQKINDFFHQLVLPNHFIAVEKDDEVINHLFQKLVDINVLYIKSIPPQIKCLVCDKFVRKFIEENKKNYLFLGELNFIDIYTLNENQLADFDNFLVICNGCSFRKIREINEKMAITKKKYYLLILETNFLHIFYHNSPKSACFECYYNSIIAQIENENYFEFLKPENMIHEPMLTDDEKKVKLNYALSCFLLLLTGSYYFEDNKSNQKLLSFYFPTLEINVTNFQKQNDCRICGQQLTSSHQ